MKAFVRILLPLAVFLAVFVLFAPSIGFPLVDYDDMTFITRNNLVLDGLSVASVKQAFTTLHGDAAMYSPLLWISWMFDVSVFGASASHPWPFHLGNVFLHAMNAVFFFFVLRRCRATPLAAALLSLLWGCHPLRVESVAWVTERKDTLSTLFAFLSILFYLKAWERGRPARDESSGAESESTRHCRKGWLCFALLAFAAGLLVKPMLVTLPFLFLLFDVFPLRRISLDTSFSFRTALRLVLEKIPFFALSIAASALSVMTQARAIHSTPFLHRLSLIPLHYAFYLIKTFIPIRLTPFYHPIVFSWRGFIPFALLFAALFVSAWRLRSSRPAWGLGILAFFGLLVPVIGFFRVGVNNFADRYSYLPAIGISIAFVPLLSASSPRVRRAALALAVLVLLALCPLSVRAMRAWSSIDAFYDNAETIFPDHFIVANYRARQLIREHGDFAAAEAILDKTLELYPDDDNLRISKALCIAEREGPAAALDFFQAIPPETLNAPELREAAQYAVLAGQFDVARAILDHAWAETPPTDSLRDVLLNVRVAAAVFSGDLEEQRRIIADTPRFAGRASLSFTDLFSFYANQWGLLHRTDAWFYFKAAANAYRNDPAFLNNLAWLLATVPGWNPAPPEDILRIARHAVSMVPDNPQLLDTLAAALANASDFPAAIETASRALELAASDPALAASIRSRIDLYRQSLPFRVADEP